MNCPEEPARLHLPFSQEPREFEAHLPLQTQGQVYFVTGAELWQWRQQAQAEAIAATIAIAEVDWFLQALTNLDRLSLRLGSFQHQSQIPLKVSWDVLTHLWQQRIQSRVPVQYLAGMAPWREFSLVVSPAVLIPRPETESLIDLAVTAVSDSSIAAELQQGHWTDLGTGSGAIALGLASTFAAATIHAVDTSPAALAIAQHNANRLTLNRIHFYQGSWLQPLAHLKGNLSGLISNPPYIPSHLVPTLQPEVSQHEPHLALDGGDDGLDCIRQLIATAPEYLHSGGIWLIEMMAGQADTVANLLQAQGDYQQIQIHRDLAGIDRFALAYRR